MPLGVSMRESDDCCHLPTYYGSDGYGRWRASLLGDPVFNMSEIQVKGVYDFQGDGEGELDFRVDEILTILRQDIGDGWWEAQNAAGQTGLIPQAYVEEIFSLPEPKEPPPPPPPATYLQNSTNNRVSWQQPANRTSWQPPAGVVPQQASITQPSWNDPQPPQVPAYQPPPDSGQQETLQPQESYDDWDEDWDDDDDSSTTTENPSYEMGGNYGSGGGITRDRGGDSAKFGTVRKGFSSKQGGDAYLFGPAVVDIPESDKITIIETSEGPFWKPIDHPFICTIASPKKSSKFHGMKSFIAYQITPSFSNIQTSRRYKHFDWLHDRMVEKYSAVIVPPLPDKQISGRYEEDFINERMRQLQYWMDRMCQHPVIAHSDVFQHFLSCTDEKQWKKGKRKAEKDEFQGGKFFLTIQAPPAPLDVKETEDKMDRFGRFVKSMDDSVRHLCTLGENNLKKHQGPFKKEFQKLGHGFVSLARSFEFDERPSAQNLTRAVEHTGKTYDEIGKLFEDQPRHDMGPLLEHLHEYKGILQVFPDVLSVHKAASQKLEENYTRLTESEAQTTQGRVDVISYATLAEMNHFNQYRTDDFKVMMQGYIQAQIDFYTKVTSMLQGTLRQYDDA